MLSKTANGAAGAPPTRRRPPPAACHPPAGRPGHRGPPRPAGVAGPWPRGLLRRRRRCCRGDAPSPEVVRGMLLDGLNRADAVRWWYWVVVLLLLLLLPGVRD